MNWRYSDRAEQPAEAAEASLPAFDGDAAELDVALVNAVEAILRRRAAAQLAKDYVVADALRDELRAEYNVAVHDREGRWRLLGARRGGSQSGLLVKESALVRGRLDACFGRAASNVPPAAPPAPPRRFLSLHWASRPCRVGGETIRVSTNPSRWRTIRRVQRACGESDGAAPPCCRGRRAFARRNVPDGGKKPSRASGTAGRPVARAQSVAV